MKTKTITNKNGLELSIGDRITVNGKAGTITGFHREMIRVELDVFPGEPITVDATWQVEKAK